MDERLVVAVGQIQMSWGYEMVAIDITRWDRKMAAYDIDTIQSQFCIEVLGYGAPDDDKYWHSVAEELEDGGEFTGQLFDAIKNKIAEVI